MLYIWPTEYDVFIYIGIQYLSFFYVKSYIPRNIQYFINSSNYKNKYLNLETITLFIMMIKYNNIHHILLTYDIYIPN